MAAFVAPIANLLTSFLGYRSGSSANARAGTALADSAQEGIVRTEDATARAMQRILDAAQNNTNEQNDMGGWWDALLQQAGDSSRQYFDQAAQTATGQVNQAAGAATGRVDAGTSNANNVLQGLLQQNTAQFSPYQTAGTTAAGNLNSLSGPVTGANRLQGLLDNPASLENTPGYQFQLQQGLQGIQQLGSAHGALQSGGMLKALTQYGQGLAGTTYQNAVSNALSSDRLELDKRGQQFGQTLATANLGMDANKGNLSGFLGLGAPQADNITSGAALGAGYGMAAGQFGGNATLASGQYGGNAMQNEAAQRVSTGADLGKWITDTRVNAARDAAGLDVAGAARIAPLLQQRGQATAASILDKSELFNNMLGSGTSGLLDIFKLKGWA